MQKQFFDREYIEEHIFTPTHSLLGYYQAENEKALVSMWLIVLRLSQENYNSFVVLFFAMIR